VAHGALAVLHAVTFALDPIFFPVLPRTEVRSPVFVVGQARSGTTYLHRMVANDPRFSYVLLWEMFFPSLLEKRLPRAALCADQRLGDGGGGASTRLMSGCSARAKVCTSQGFSRRRRTSSC
jgi:hypothetical protein